MMVRGLEDLSMQGKIMTLVAEKGEQTLPQLVAHVEAMETSKRSQGLLGTGQLSPVGCSSGKPQPKQKAPANSRAKCRGCGRDPATHKGECFAKKLDCNNCGKKGHIGRVCQALMKKVTGAANKVEASVVTEESGDVTSLSPVMSPSREGAFFFTGEVNMHGTNHNIFSEGRWKPRKVRPHPIMDVVVRVDLEAYIELGLQEPRLGSWTGRRLPALADTGAQMCVLGEAQAASVGLELDQLATPNLTINTADRGVARNLGMVLFEISGVGDDGVRRTTRQQSYILEGAGNLFLSCEALKGLGCIHEKFPEVCAVYFIRDRHQAQQESGPDPQVLSAGAGEARPCKCPTRGKPPPPKEKLPFPATPENIPRLRQWLVEHYSGCAFNQCTHQKLPLMKGAPPLRLHVDTEARPVACHRPGNVPLHLMESVKAGLDKNVRTGVLRKVGVNEPVEWCSRMVVCAKKKGKARRTVDFKALNQAAP